MKINFYFNGEAVSDLPYQLITAYTNQFLKEMTSEMHQQIASNNDQLNIYVTDIITNGNTGNEQFEANQFEMLYTSKPFIFTPSDHFTACWMSMKGKVNAEQQIELTSIANLEQEMKQGTFDAVTTNLKTPYIVDIIHYNSPASAQINELNSNESSLLNKLPFELMPLITRSLPGYNEIASIFTPDMQMFAQTIHTEIQRLLKMDDDFAHDKAKALTEAKERVLRIAASASFFSLTQFYTYKEGHEASIDEVASRKLHPEWDQSTNDLFRGYGLWHSGDETKTSSLVGSGGLTVTEKKLRYAAQEPKLMLDGDWQDELLSASHNLRNTSRLKF